MLEFQEEIRHHGGHKGVTGSCHEWLYADDASIMIDCGLFQGEEASNQTLNFSSDISRVKALVLTHGHIDHVGRIPWLIAAGFRGPIFCSIPTARLLPVIMEDALQLQLPDQEELVKSTLSRLDKQIVGIPYGKTIPMAYSVTNDMAPPTVTLQNAGHILGSAYVEIAYRGEVTVFSGDLGSSGALINDPPKPPARADRLVLESTYGDRIHRDRHLRIDDLKMIIQRSLTDGGPILIPAFSMGRTQELLAVIEKIKIEAGLTTDFVEPWEGQQLPIILDSPLASRITAVYRQLRPWWKRSTQDHHPFSYDSLATVETHREHNSVVKYLQKTNKPAIVISASGMCEGGRIVNYLKTFLPQENTDIVFVGYQAKGTLGRSLQDLGESTRYSSERNHNMVTIDGDGYAARARIHKMSGFSSHADQTELLQFVNGISVPPKEIRLVHGNLQARRQLAQKLVGQNVVY